MGSTRSRVLTRVNVSLAVLVVAGGLGGMHRLRVLLAASPTNPGIEGAWMELIVGLCCALAALLIASTLLDHYERRLLAVLASSVVALLIVPSLALVVSSLTYPYY